MAPVEGQTFTLTSNADVVSGGAGDDTIAGGKGTIDNDTITAGAGSDTLNLTITNADDDGAAFTATGLETINLRGTGATGNTSVDFGDVAGLENLTFRRMGEDVTIDNLADLDTALKVENTASATSAIVVNYEAGQVSGSADSVSLTIDNVTSSDDIDINGVETIAVTAVGEDNDIDLDGDDLETVTVAGSGDIAIEVDASVTTFNASSSTGDVTMTAAAAANVTATGGSGADTFTMGTTLTANDTIDGGDGADTLGVTGAGGAVVPASADVSNVETLSVTTGGTDTFDASIVSFDNVKVVAAANTHTMTMTNVTDEVITITESAGNALDVIDVSLSDATGSADSLTINVTNTDATTALTVDDIDSTDGGIETLNLVLNQGVDIEDASDILIDDISSTHDTLNVSGAADATFGAGVSITTAEINTANSTGDMTLTLGAATSDVTLGNGTNTVTFDAAAYTSVDTVAGGTGTDTVVTGNLAAGTHNATLTGVETLRAEFGTSSAALSMLGADATTTRLDLSGDEAHVVSNISSNVSTINIASTDADGGETVGLTFATSTDSAHTVVIGDVVDGTAGDDVDVDVVTISTNDGDLSIVSDGAAGNSVDRIVANSTDSLTISTTKALEVDDADGGTDGDIVATDADAVTLTTAGGTLLVDGAQDFSDAETIALNANDGTMTLSGAMDGSDATSLTVTTDGDFDQTGNFTSDADIEVTLTSTGLNGNLRYDGILDVDHATTITMNATSGGDIIVDDIELLGKNADLDDITSAIVINATGTDTAGNGSGVTISAINTATATLDSITVTGDADSTVSITTGGAALTVTDIVATSMAGDFTLDGSAVAALLDVATGAGTNDLSLEEGLAHTVTLGASSGTDTINLLDDNEGTSAAMIITNFETGDNGDIISIDTSDMDGSDAVGAENELGTALGVATTVIMQTDADGTLTADAGASIFKLTDTFADISAVVTAMDGNLTGLTTTDNAAIFVLWSDGANSYLSTVQDNGGSAAGIDGGENLIQFVGTTLGTSSTTGFTVDNFAFV